YDKDPVKCADAVRFDKITYHEVLVRGLQVMDSTATALCQDNRMPILVLNIDGEDTVKRALAGEPVCTLVYQED
ncbi:UMP kinase, partial [Streptococcus gordonii]|nr:UMP kinase [Streptococcus gordonii]